MPGFTSGLARGLGAGAQMARRPGADPSEMQRQSRLSGLMGRIGQTNMNTSTAKPMSKPGLPAMTPKPGPRLAAPPPVTGGRTPPMATRGGSVPVSAPLPRPEANPSREAWEAARARAAGAAGGNMTKSAMFEEGGMVGRGYAKA